MGSTFRSPLCKIRKLVMVYNRKASINIFHPRTFYMLYIGPNDSGTGHSVFKLLVKQLLTTPKCKPVPMPMPEDVFKHLFGK